MALFLFSLSFLFGKFGKEPFFKSFLIAKGQHRQSGKYGYDRDPDRNAPAAKRNQRSAPEKQYTAMMNGRTMTITPKK